MLLEKTEITYSLKTHTHKKLDAGEKYPLGATLKPNGVNFALYSKYSTDVYLLLFKEYQNEPTDIIKINNKTDDVWHVFVHGLKTGQMYGYKVNGEYDPNNGKRYNPYKLLIDPYAKAVSGKHINKDNLIFGYDLNSDRKDLKPDYRDNTHIVPKSIVINDEFDWHEDKSPEIPPEDLIIYEVHVKGFTAHNSSKVKYPGTYLGFIEKIPYLKKLGVNAVELMPVHDFFIRKELIEKGLTDYWGYNTLCFFAPEFSYSTKRYPGCQVKEFKTLIRELHKQGIEVILDAVYNHTGEGNELGPTLSFKGIDNGTYYSLVGNPANPNEPYRYYLNDTGTGNTLNIENPTVLNLVLDSLRYWVSVMHIDGIRYDLASILARVKGEFSRQSLFFEEILKDPVLNKVKMIAEPWDLKSYQVGKFPLGWSEWNGKFRDNLRRFLRGDESQAKELSKRITGSADLYQEDGRFPHNSVNFITCHDGFTLADLYSYNSKHNEANLEDNRDGSNNNFSCNCGAEGQTDDKKIVNLRKLMIKNALTCVLFSFGTPMILYGDELMRTQKGNNNVYCQDNELSWFNWNDFKNNFDIFEFTKKCICLRKNYSMLRRNKFFIGQNNGNIPQISWFDKKLTILNWINPKIKTLCYQLSNDEMKCAPDKHYFFFIFNLHKRNATIKISKFDNLKWYRLIDTRRDFKTEKKEKLLKNQETYHSYAKSVVVLLGVC